MKLKIHFLKQKLPLNVVSNKKEKYIHCLNHFFESQKATHNVLPDTVDFVGKFFGVSTESASKFVYRYATMFQKGGQKKSRMVNLN